MKLLLLGGTADGRKLAALLHEQGIEVIYSIAGLVRKPPLDCQIISGGFSQHGGLVSYLQQEKITAVLDVTHPYAQQMSSTAQAVCESLNLPYWRFHRQAWQAECGDDWRGYTDNVELIHLLKKALTTETNILFSIGQLDAELLQLLADLVKRTAEQGITLRLIVRTAVAPKIPLLADMHWLKAIGPFYFDDEKALLQQHKISLMVSKNSGGDSTYPKLVAARQLQIPVFMQTRPELADIETEFNDLNDCAEFVAGFSRSFTSPR